MSENTQAPAQAQAQAPAAIAPEKPITQVPRQTPLKEFFGRQVVKNKIAELVGKNSAAFATSVMQIAQSNSMLATATPESIFSAACMAATLNLPINAILGFAHIVPYRNRKLNRVEAQFQIGWKGYIQLAQRTGQFKRISVTSVRDGQLIKKNPLTGYEFDFDSGWENEVIGFAAYFQLLNGFEATLYMSKDEMINHAKRYSQSFQKQYGVWFDNFDSMAHKTVIKLLLSRFAPLSIDSPIHKAIESDSAILQDSGVAYYPDNSQDFEAIEVDQLSE
jgi:recombination protein RecT